MRIFTVFIFTAFCIGFSGCGSSGPEIAGVRGTITMDGAPLAEATVVFMPESGRPAGARTDSEGKYVLNFSGGRKGAQPGNYRVQVTTQSDASTNPDGTTKPGSPETIPAKYNVMTTLEATVVEDQDNVIDFDLTSDGAVRNENLGS